MKISNESKIGIIVIFALAILFFGFAFLKGKSVFHKETKMYAVYNDVMGLKKSSKVVVNGIGVGKITDIDGGRNMRRLVVTITFSKEIDVPENSLAVINPDLIGSTSLEIKLGDAKKFKRNGDTLMTAPSTGALDEALKVINPVLYEVRSAASSLDSLLQIFSAVFDTTSKNNLKSIIGNVNLTTEALAASSQSLQAMMNPKDGALSRTIDNTRLFTDNLNKNNERIDSIMTNFNTVSGKFAEMDIARTLDSLNLVIGNLNTISTRLNNKEGSLGLLLNDDGLYDQLESATNKVRILLDDIRVHPGRYINLSVFGKRNSKNYLTAPLVDDTILLINKANERASKSVID